MWFKILIKRLALPLLAALALPTAVNAEEFTEIKPKNIYSYKKSSLVKWENENSEGYISNKTNDLDVIKTALEFQTIKVI